MIKRILFAGIIAGAGIGIYLIAAPESQKTPTETPLSTSMVTSVPTSGVVPVVPKTASPVMNEKASEATTSPDIVAGKNDVWTNYERQPELNRYAHLRRKVFLSDEEKSERRRLLEDREFLMSLRSLLLSEAPKDDTSMQNAALDYVFEALRSGDKQAARELLQAVVQSPAIEDTALDLQTRKSLGGVKAEVLFQWSSLDADAPAMIEGALPGPVSKKIWARVQEQQENNLAESATLQAQR